MAETKGILGLFTVICMLGAARSQLVPQITERILPEIRRLGTQGQLHCVIINQQDNSCYWIHKDANTFISRDEEIVVDHNPIVNGYPKFQVEREVVDETTYYSIIISRLETRDAGLYTCQCIVRGESDYPSMDGELVVLYAPAMVLSQTTTTVSVRSGDAVNLTCDATGYPTPNITWVRVSGSPLPDGKLRHIGKVYPIEAVDVQHRGIYRCLADNAVIPPAVHDATLLVLFSPTAKAIQSSYGQAENRMFDVTIECRIAGWPEPDLQWYKVLEGGIWDPINNDDKHTINILLNHANILGTNERWFQMVVRAVQANDFGDYICAGRNNMGEGYDTVNLFATSECQGPNCPPEMSTPGAAPALQTHARALGTTVAAAVLAVLMVAFV